MSANIKASPQQSTTKDCFLTEKYTTINKLVSPKNRFSSIHGAAGNSNHSKTSRGLATARGSGFLGGGPSHHPCATNGILLEEAHGIFRSGIPGLRGLYGSGQLGDRFGRRR